MELGSIASTIGSIIQAALFGLFALMTAALVAIVGPTYNNLVVPEMQAGQLFPSLTQATGGGPNYLVQAAHFSDYLLVNVVDPLVALVAIGLGLVFLARAVWSRSGVWAEGLVARFIIAVVLANFAVPVAGGILDVAGAIYPVVAGWDGGAWQNWTNLAGVGELSLSWQNGALAFVLAFVEFSVVFLLALMIGVRDAALAVPLVVLPLFTLVWPLKPLSPLAKRGWFLFAELAFLPCVLVIPLELAVGSPNVILLVAYLSLALASPFLISIAGGQLSALGFPSVGNVLTGGVERGLLGASRSASAPFAGAGSGAGGSSVAQQVGGVARAAGATTLPASAPALVAGAIGSGASHLVRHIRGQVPGATLNSPNSELSEIARDKPRFRPVKPGTGGFDG